MSAVFPMIHFADACSVMPTDPFTSKSQMKEPAPDAAQIHEMIRGLSQKHILSNSPRTYVDDFVVAALEVYDPATLQKILQHKFFIPDESNYKEDTYYQSACRKTDGADLLSRFLVSLLQFTSI